jgi:signal transduction histidine kinase
MTELPGPRDLTITVRRDGSDVHVAERDRGCGIAPALLPSIFDPFYSTKADGMGMGLAICRNCIEALGGRLWAESTIGAGTTAHFKIPAAAESLCPTS